MRGSKGQNAAAAYRAKVLATGPIAYWPLNETSGAVATCLVNAAQNGAYTGVTLANVADPTGAGVAPYWDGLNDYCNVYTATLAAALSKTTGTMLLWAKRPNPPGWDLANIADLFRPVFVNTSNTLGISKVNAAAWWEYMQGATVVRRTDTPATDAWLCLACTWSTVADEFLAFKNGAQVSTTGTGLVAPSGALSKAVIGARDTTATRPWQGWIAHVALWNTALAPATIATLAVP